MHREIEVMRVVRVPPMGRLVVESGGQRLEQLSEAGTEQVRQRVLAAAGELVAFVGGYDVLVAAGVAPPLPSQQPEEHPAEEVLNEEQTAFLDQLERDLKATTTGTPEVAVPGVEVVEEVTAETSTPPESSVNLVAQIDSILQKHVAANPVLSRRSIHLVQPPGGLLQIRVDNATYEHPNEIEDEDVRLVLKQALREWESR